MNSNDEEKLNIRIKELSRIEKVMDTINSDIRVAAIYDLEAILPCPHGNVASLYYVSKLNVISFTIFDMQSRDVYR